MMIMGHAKAQHLSLRDKDLAIHSPPGHSIKGRHSTTEHPGTMQQHQDSRTYASGPQQQTSMPSNGDDEEELNFHDYIHAKHDDDKEGDDTRSTVASPMPSHTTISKLEKGHTTRTNETQSDRDMQNTSQDHISTNDYTHPDHYTASSHAKDSGDTHMSSSDMDHIYGSSSSSHFPSYDQVPPPTQDLFRTLMEELQTQAAIQRDQFMASSTKAESNADAMDDSFNNHHARSLPRFMMEPLDFLSANYESCLEPAQDSKAGPSSRAEEHSFHGQFPSSFQQQTVGSASSSESTATFSSHAPPSSEVQDALSTRGSASKKRQLTDDTHLNDSTITPPSVSPDHDQQSPPTQDLFRMLMEELETQAALQRDQFLASTAKSDTTAPTMESTDFSFNGHHHHTKLPRFAMDFDFLSPGYGTMQVEESSASQSLRTNQDVYMSSAETHESIRAMANESSKHISSDSLQLHEENPSPPTQDLFRTLMEELETQAAFQRDQALAATTGSAPKVDPEEYVFNGQHLRPLPRFMFEPLDFLSGSYESCFHGDDQGGMSSCSHFNHSQSPFLNMSMPRSPEAVSSASGTKTSTLTGRRNSASKGPRRPSNGSVKYKTILPQSSKPVTTPSTEPVPSGSNPPKRRKIDDETDTPTPNFSSFSGSDSSITSLATEPGPSECPESPISPTTSISALSIAGSPMNATGTVKEGSVEAPTGAPKRPWTPKDEALLLKLFAKRTPIKEIAETLDRTVHSVRSRRQILTDPGFVKGKGHSVSRRCKRDPATTTKLPTYAQMAFLSLAWLPELEGTLNDVATMVEKLFSRHLNRIPRTGHKNLQIWRAQISDALAHEKGQPRPRFESFGVKRGRQWVYRLTDFGKGVVEAMGGVDQICEDLLRNNQMEMDQGLDKDSIFAASDIHHGSKDADGHKGGSGADAGIGQGQGYGYSYRTPDARQRTKKGSSRSKVKTAESRDRKGSLTGVMAGGERETNAIANAMEAMAAGLAKMMALEDERIQASYAGARQF
ncbi:hypothetical protein BGX28_000774 [Mortierella sp. GBA30]|nr:hypothetical protein BGX28_000774 [Mortierella sp. GBA30]